MRDVFVGGTGMILGGALGVGGTVVLELMLAGAVAATLMFTAPTELAPAPVTRTVQATPTRSQPVARPGELQLMTMAAVQPLVDGVPMPYDPNQGFLAELPPGTHRVQVIDMLGRQVATTDVEVLASERSQLRWASKQLSDLGRVPMLGGPVVSSRPVAPSAPVATARVEAGIERADQQIDRANQEIDRAMAEVDAAMAEVEQHRNTVETLADGILAIGAGEVRLPKLGKRLGRN